MLSDDFYNKFADYVMEHEPEMFNRLAKDYLIAMTKTLVKNIFIEKIEEDCCENCKYSSYDRKANELFCLAQGPTIIKVDSYNKCFRWKKSDK